MSHISLQYARTSLSQETYICNEAMQADSVCEDLQVGQWVKLQGENSQIKLKRDEQITALRCASRHRIIYLYVGDRSVLPIHKRRVLLYLKWKKVASTLIVMAIIRVWARMFAPTIIPRASVSFQLSFMIKLDSIQYIVTQYKLLLIRHATTWKKFRLSHCHK